MRIRFLIDQVYETEGPGKGPRFAAGDVIGLDDVAANLPRLSPAARLDFLDRWVRRGVAVREADAEFDAEEALEPALDHILGGEKMGGAEGGEAQPEGSFAEPEEDREVVIESVGDETAAPAAAEEQPADVAAEHAKSARRARQ